MRKIFIILFVLLTSSANAQVTFMGLSVYQSFDTFRELLCHKASFDENYTDFIGLRCTKFHAYYAGFMGCEVDISEDDAGRLKSIWVKLPVYEGKSRVYESKIDYKNLVKAYSQKYGTPIEKPDDSLWMDILNCFTIGNTEITIGYVTFEEIARVEVHYIIRNGHKINSNDI